MAAIWLAWAIVQLLISCVTAQSIDPISVFVSEAYSVYTQVTSLLASAASAASEESTSSRTTSSSSTSTTSQSTSSTSASTSPTSSLPPSSSAASASSGASAAAASATSAANDGGGTGTNVTAIVLGCVLGALALGLLILVFLLCCRRRMRRKSSPRSTSPDAVAGGGWRRRRRRRGPVPGSAIDEEHSRHNAPLMTQAPAYRGPGEHENPFVPVPPPPRRSTPTNRSGFHDVPVTGGNHIRSSSRSPNRGGALAAGAGGAALGAAAMHHHNKSKDRDIYDEKRDFSGPDVGRTAVGGPGRIDSPSSRSGFGTDRSLATSPTVGTGGLGSTPTPGRLSTEPVGHNESLQHRGPGLGAPAAAAGGALLGAGAMHHHNKDRDVYNEKGPLGGTVGGGVLTGPQNTSRVADNVNRGGIASDRNLATSTPLGGANVPVGAGGMAGGPLVRNDGHGHMGSRGLGAPAAAAGGAALGAAAMHHRNNDRELQSDRDRLASPPGIGGGTMPGVGGSALGPHGIHRNDSPIGKGNVLSDRNVGGFNGGSDGVREVTPLSGRNAMPGGTGSPLGSTNPGGIGTGPTSLASHERDRFNGRSGVAAPAALGGAALGAAAMHHHNKDNDGREIVAERDRAMGPNTAGTGLPVNRGPGISGPGTSGGTGPGITGVSGPGGSGSGIPGVLRPEAAALAGNPRTTSPAVGSAPALSNERFAPQGSGRFTPTSNDRSGLPGGPLLPAAGGAALGAAAMRHHNINDSVTAREGRPFEDGIVRNAAGPPGSTGFGVRGPGGSGVSSVSPGPGLGRVGGGRFLPSENERVSPLGAGEFGTPGSNRLYLSDDERSRYAGGPLLPAAGGAALGAAAARPHHHGNDRGIVGSGPNLGGEPIRNEPGPLGSTGSVRPGASESFRPGVPAVGGTGPIGGQRLLPDENERSNPIGAGGAGVGNPVSNRFSSNENDRSGIPGGALLPAAGGAALGAAAMHHHDRDRVDDNSSMTPSEHRIGRKPVANAPPSSYEQGPYPSPSTNDDAFALNKAPRRRSTSSGHRSVSRDATRANAAFDNGYAQPSGSGSIVPAAVAAGAGTGALGGAALGHRRKSSSHGRSPRRPSAGAKDSDSSGTSSNYSDAVPHTTMHTTINTTAVNPTPGLPTDIPPAPLTRSRRNSALGTAAPPAALGSYQNRSPSQPRSRSPGRRRPVSYPPLPGTSSSQFNTRESIGNNLNTSRNPNEPFPVMRDSNLPMSPPGLGASSTSDRAIVGDNGYPHMGVPRRKSGGAYDYMGEGPYAQQALPVDAPPVPSSTETSDDSSTWRLSSGMPGGWGRKNRPADRDSGVSGMSGSTAIGGGNGNGNGNGNGTPGRRFRASDLPSQVQEDPHSMMARGRHSIEPEWSGNGGYDGYERHPYERGVGTAM